MNENCFTLDGKTHVAVPTDTEKSECSGCAFEVGSCLHIVKPSCDLTEREDERDVIWVEAPACLHDENCHALKPFECPFHGMC